MFYMREHKNTIWTQMIRNEIFYLFQTDIPGVTGNGMRIEDERPILITLETDRPILITLETDRPILITLETDRKLYYKRSKRSNSYIIENMEKISRPSYQENVSAKKIYRNGKNARDNINQKKKLAQK